MSPVRTTPKDRRGSEQLILRHLDLVDGHVASRQPARMRLDEALGPAFAQRLVSSLSLSQRVGRV